MSKTNRFKINPFLEDMIIPVKGKQVRLSVLGKDNDVLINETTGEVHGTHVITYKKVDGEQFVKLFTENIGMTFDLTSSGIKTFGVLLWAVQCNGLEKDTIDLDSFTLDEFTEKYKNHKKPLHLSLATLKRGINELERAQIVAKTVRKGRYFLNPNFVFNGNRIAFTTMIQKKQENQEITN